MNTTDQETIEQAYARGKADTERHYARALAEARAEQKRLEKIARDAQKELKDAGKEFAVIQEWTSVASKLSMRIHEASHKLPTLSLARYFTQAHWVITDALRADLQALDRRLEQLSTQGRGFVDADQEQAK